MEIDLMKDYREVMKDLKREMRQLSLDMRTKSRMLVILDDDPVWLKRFREWMEMAHPEVEIKTFSDTEKFKAFMKVNGHCSAVIDINLADQEGPQCVVEILDDLEDVDIVFTSSARPSKEDLHVISEIGGRYVEKPDRVVEFARLYEQGEAK